MLKEAPMSRCSLAILLVFIGAMMLAFLPSASEAEAAQGIWYCRHGEFFEYNQVGRRTCLETEGVGRVEDDFATYYWGGNPGYTPLGTLVDCAFEGMTEYCFAPAQYRSGSYSSIDYFWFGADLLCANGNYSNQGRCLPVSGLVVDETCPLCAGNPVDVLSGRKHEQVTDWSSAGNMPLTLERYFSSYTSGFIPSSSQAASRLGTGWRTGFDAFLNWSGVSPEHASVVSLVLPNSLEYHFVKREGAWIPRMLSPDSDVGYRDRTDIDISFTNDSYGGTIRMQDGKRYVFDAEGKLVQILYPGGYAQDLTYTDGRNTRVSDNLGRWMTFSYEQNGEHNLLTGVRTSDGQAIAYSYVNRLPPGRGVILHGPIFWALRSVTYPDDTPANASDNPKAQYQYFLDTQNLFLLSSITDERGVRFAEWAYDDDGRAIISQHAGGTERWIFGYDDATNRVILINPLGQKSIYSYRRFNSMVRQLISVEAEATDTTPRTMTSYDYDSNGFKILEIDAEGNRTRWVRNDRGLPLSETRAHGTAERRTRTMTWDRSRPLMTGLSEPGRTTAITYDDLSRITSVQQVDTDGQTRTTTYRYAPLSGAAATRRVSTARLRDVRLPVANPSASKGTQGWRTVSGKLRSMTGGPCGNATCFAATQAPAVMSSDIAIPAANLAELGAGQRDLVVTWRELDVRGRMAVFVTSLDGAGRVIGGKPRRYMLPPAAKWAQRSLTVGSLAPQARTLRISFSFGPAFDGSSQPGAAGYWTDIAATLVQSRTPASPPIELLAAVDGPLPGPADTVHYDYDQSGNLIAVTDELGHVTRITAFDAGGRPLRAVDANGTVSESTYDSRGRLASVTVNPGPSQARTQFAYDAVGQVTRVTAPDGSYLDYVWSDARRLVTVTNNAGESISYDYDLNGDITSRKVKSASGAIVRQQAAVFDALGRQLQKIGAVGQKTLFTYDRIDNLVQVKDPRGGVFSYAYDGLQQLIATTDQTKSRVELARDGQGQLAAYTDARGLTTSYVRNGFGEIIAESGPDIGTTRITRDERGLATRIVDPRGIVSTLVYDAAGRLIQQSYPADPREDVTYSYDDTTGGNNGVGRLTGMTDQSGSLARVYDALGRVVSETRVIEGQRYVIGYSYDAAGHLTGITYPSGRAVGYARNGLGKVTGVATRAASGSAVQAIAGAIGWSPMSALPTSLTHGNGLVTSWTYTGDGRIATLLLANGKTRIQGMSYGYGDGINLTTLFDSNVLASATMAYDAAQRLTSWRTLASSLVYAYNANGDRVKEDLWPLGGGMRITTQLAYPANSNRLDSTSVGKLTTRRYAYDAAGNIVTQFLSTTQRLDFAYNQRNRPVAVTRSGGVNVVSRYAFNALEQMVSRRTTAAGGPRGTVHYIYGLDGALLAEADGATGAILRDYIWLPAEEAMPEAVNDNVDAASATPLPLALVTAVDTATPRLLMVHADHLRRPIRLTDMNRATVWSASYDPFGLPLAVTGTVEQNLRFPGQYFLLETGLAYNWHRFYDPATGRYTQPDPLRFVDGPSVYGYAGGSPLVNIDPEGQDWVDAMGGYYAQSPTNNYAGSNYNAAEHPLLTAGMMTLPLAAAAGGEAAAAAAAELGTAACEAGLNVGTKMLGPESPLFKRRGGLLNSNDYFRIGWNWNNNKAGGGGPVFRIAIGGKNLPIHWHLDLK